MCGGAEREPKNSGGTYTPPALESNYQTFRDTGNVPYSYYGVGAPTREGEVDLVRKSYPGAFSQAAPPAAGGQGSGNNIFSDILAALQTFTSRSAGPRSPGDGEVSADAMQPFLDLMRR